jgi:hypothetical protein
MGDEAGRDMQQWYDRRKKSKPLRCDSLIIDPDGAPRRPYTLRVTQVYRREDGEWKVVHRNADQIPIDQRQGLPGEASTQ